MNVVVATQPAVNFQSSTAVVIKDVMAVKEVGKDVDLFFSSRTRFDEAVALLNDCVVNLNHPRITLFKKDIVSITITQD